MSGRVSLKLGLWSTLLSVMLFGRIAEALISTNSLTFNALTHNALSFNSLTYNAITINALTVNALANNALTSNAVTSNGLNGLQLPKVPSVTLEGFTLESIKTRMQEPNNTLQEILPFLIHCTLPPWKSFTAPNETESISGVFGFAPNIDKIPLEPDQAKMVSACLISLVNYYGHHVQVSGRNMPYAAAVPAEISAWSVYEGAFFGNVWEEKKFACRGDPLTTAMEASSDRSWRRCTDPGISCGFTIVGNCADACEGFTPGYGYSTCRGTDDLYYPAMNIFLESNLAVVASAQSDDTDDPSAGAF